MKLTPIPPTKWSLKISEGNLINGWAADIPQVTMKLTREGSWCTLVVPEFALSGSAASADQFFIPPPGYTPNRDGNYGFVGPALATDTMVAVRRELSSHNYYLSCQARGSIQGTFQWGTLDPPPPAI